MKINLLIGSSSRNSGGLYNSVRMLGQTLNTLEKTEAEVLAHHDEFSDLDLPAYAGLPVKEYKIKGPANFGYSPDLGQVLEQLRPDVVHTQCIWMYLSRESLQYKKRHNTGLVISPRGMIDQWGLKKSSFKKKLVAQWFENEHLSQANALHALCEPEAKSMRAYGLKNKIFIVPNAVRLPDEDKNRSILEQHEDYLNKNKNFKKLLFLGRIHEKKGLENLIDAFKKADKENKTRDWQLHIAGWGDEMYVESLKKRVSEANLNRKILFIGSKLKDEKALEFLTADAFILPSFSEGLPMAVLEAWSYRLPVLITPECNISEGFKADAAIKITPESNSIYEGLCQLTEAEPADLKNIGNNGYSLVVEKFTWDRVGRDMRRIYEWTCGGNLPNNITEY